MQYYCQLNKHGSTYYPSMVFSGVELTQHAIKLPAYSNTYMTGEYSTAWSYNHKADGTGSDDNLVKHCQSNRVFLSELCGGTGSTLVNKHSNNVTKFPQSLQYWCFDKSDYPSITMVLVKVVSLATSLPISV